MQKVSDLTKYTANINYKKDLDRIKKFLLFYNEEEKNIYLERIRNLVDGIEISLTHVALYDDTGLAYRIKGNAYSYLRIFSAAIDEIIYDDEGSEIDSFFYRRVSEFKEKHPDKKATDYFPPFLLRNYAIHLRDERLTTVSIRELKSEKIGKLQVVRGLVTRVSIVNPSVRVATYVCENCGCETYQQIGEEVFDLLEECTSDRCKRQNIKGRLCLLTRGSRFLRAQTIYIQELTSDVPQGSIPRTMGIECYGDCTNMCKPGDVIKITGILMPRPHYGFKKMKAGLLHDIYFMGTWIEVAGSSKKEERDSKESLDIPIEKKILLDSFAPEIFGMRDVKLILLLMIVGAPSIVRKDGMKIRGDINVLLVGDPGIAKSQLLKTAVRLSARGIYTTGRGSSGVGLTASIMKDPGTGELLLEGGALVLADGGVCCIDELDKMCVYDRIAIHEAMEQQTISVSKAGITTTLNARCSVLAAANPIKGRYDPNKTVSQNIGLPVSLMSRFDILCVLKDDPDSDYDAKMALSILNLHQEGKTEEKGVLSYEELSKYIEKARKIKPKLPEKHRGILVDAYLKARKDEDITPRYLMGLIRVSMAHARLRLSEEVSREDVESAISLLNSTRIPKITRERIPLKTEIYNFIISMLHEKNSDEKSVLLEDLYNESKYERSDLERVISEFENAGVWVRTDKEIVIYM